MEPGTINHHQSTTESAQTEKATTGFEDIPTAPTSQADEILAKAQQKVATSVTSQPHPPTMTNFIFATQRSVFWLAKHWLAIFNVVALLYVGGAILAPVFMHFGLVKPSHILYQFYKPFCHQYPFRSWFLFGEHAHYPLEEKLTVLEMNQRRQFIGDPDTGYKIAFCQRCLGIYGAIFLGGALYGLLRHFKHLHALPIWVYIGIGIIPMGLDGGIQLFSQALWMMDLVPHPYEATPLSRSITGVLFGLGAVGVAYPYIEEFFQDVYQTLAQRYGWS